MERTNPERIKLVNSGSIQETAASLARRAALVTLSEESDWVNLLRLPGETFTGMPAAARLTAAIAD